MSLESLARGLQVLAVLGGWIGTVSVLPSVHELPHPFGLALYTPLAWLTMPAVVMACTVAQVLLLGLWASGRGGLAAVLPSLALVQTYAFVEASFSAVPGDLAGHGKVLPYLVWLGLEVGRAVRPGPAGRALGVELGSGIVGVLYVMGGLSKLQTAGLGWLDGKALTLLVAERLSGAPAPVRPALEVLTRSPELGAALLGTALVVELGGAVFWWPRGRLPWAVAVTLMHAGIGLALGYVYAEWVFAIWALVVWTRLKATAPAAPG